MPTLEEILRRNGFRHVRPLSPCATLFERLHQNRAGGLWPDSSRGARFIAGQLGLLWDHSDGYPWSSSTRDHHLAQVRQFTGWRSPTAQDKLDLEQWLRQRAAHEAHSAEALLDRACEHPA